MRKVRCLAARGTYAERVTLSPPGAAMASRDDQPKGLLRRGSSPACRPGRAGRSRATSWVLVLGVLLSLMGSLAGCGATSAAIPQASKLVILVSVFDHESDTHTPSETTYLVITLRRPDSSAAFHTDSIVVGTDVQTLTCGDTSLQPVDANSLSEPHAGSYVGSVPPQSGAYVCTYFWNQGAKQATLTIPVELPTLPHIQSPASRATLAVPAPDERGITLTYNNAGSTVAKVVAAANDYNKRAASSDAGNDDGSATIVPQKFPQTFSVGWGTLSLTRSITNVNISTAGANAAFASVYLDTFDQLDQIPVFWV